MIYGWLDKVHRYGRLVDQYYQRWDAVEQDWDYNVPNCQLELAVRMGTDSMVGSTPFEGIAPGLRDVANLDNNYNFDVATFDAHADDWCWAEAVAAINAGQAFVWSVNQPSLTHSMSVFGYDNVARTYWLHTTWYPPGEWWHYCNNGAQTYARVDIVQPISPAPDAAVELEGPLGDMRYNADGQGEVWHVWETRMVVWDAHWLEQDSAKVYYSPQGGQPGTWSLWGTTTAYYLPVSVESWMMGYANRFQVELYYHSANAPYAAADGSHGNFRVVREAPPEPEIIWPPNNAIIRTNDPNGSTPELKVHRISYAQEYNFLVSNDVVGVMESGWIADTVWCPRIHLPVGSTGFWKCRARNPFDTGPWTANASYTIALFASKSTVFPRHPPFMKKKHVKHGGTVTHKKKKMRAILQEEDESIYMMTGNNTLDFQRYSVWNDTWCYVCSLPPGPRNKKVKTGAYLAADEDYVYAFKGGGTSEFYRYDPDQDAWDSLASPQFSKGFRGGFAAQVYLDSQSLIYAGNGAGTSEWQRFRTGTGVWEPARPASLPVAKAKIGSSLTWDGDSTLYFLHAGGAENDFYALNLLDTSSAWVKKKSLPLIAVSRKKKVKEGGCIEYFQSEVYAVKGGGTKEFWSYDPGCDSWAYLGELGQGGPVQPTKGIVCGRPLTAGTYGLYILIGNNTDEFFFYPDEEPRGEEPQRLAEPGPGAMGAGPVARTGTLGLDASPNPIRGNTFIHYSLAAPGRVSLKLYDVTGKLVSTLVSGYAAAGTHAVSFRSPQSAIHIPAGAYLLRLETEGHSTSRKLILQ